MSRLIKFMIGILLIPVLAGCIGEEYDFSPPTVSLINPDDITQEEKLAEANIDWTYDNKYNKETKDIYSLAKRQSKMVFTAGQNIHFSIEDGHFDIKKVQIALWQNEDKIEVAIDHTGQSFTLPNEKGEYIIVVDLPTDKGDAQYVGNIVIQ